MAATVLAPEPGQTMAAAFDVLDTRLDASAIGSVLRSWEGFGRDRAARLAILGLVFDAMAACIPSQHLISALAARHPDVIVACEDEEDAFQALCAELDLLASAAARRWRPGRRQMLERHRLLVRQAATGYALARMAWCQTLADLGRAVEGEVDLDDHGTLPS